MRPNAFVDDHDDVCGFFLRKHGGSSILFSGGRRRYPVVFHDCWRVRVRFVCPVYAGRTVSAVLSHLFIAKTLMRKEWCFWRFLDY